MKSKVQTCDSGLVCLICGKRLCPNMSKMKRHMREIHLSFDGAYHCPTCDKYFKNRMGIYNHIKRWHEDWKGINCDSFAV